MKRALKNFYLVVGLIAACVIGNEPALGQEQGILPIKATIIQIQEKSLELLLIREIGGTKTKREIRFQVDKDSRFDRVDARIVNGKLQITRTQITHKDLLPTQEINIIALLTGDRPTILFGVVDATKASKTEILRLIAKLGGSVSKIPWIESENHWEINLSNTKVTDQELQIIAPFDGLAHLDLSNTNITDKGIAHLINHPSLSDVILSRTKVTNRSLTYLSSLKLLNRLYVEQTAISRDALLRFVKEKRTLARICHIGAGKECEYRITEELVVAPYHSPYVGLLRWGLTYARFYPKAALRRIATTYYHRKGPVGAVLRPFEWFPKNWLNNNPADARMPASLVGHSAGAIGLPTNALVCLWSEPAIGVVELNGGTIAAYGRPFQSIDFYNNIPELVPFNVKINGKEPPFGFIEDARGRGCNVRIINGPFKKTVRQEAPRGYYNALFLNISVRQRKDPRALKKEDVHFDLMTQEGLRELMERTTPDGVVCFHISHRTHEFDKPLAAAAAALGYSSKLVRDQGTNSDGQLIISDRSHVSSVWVIIARTPKHLARFQNGFADRASNLDWTIPPGDEFPAWRDGVEPEMPLRR